MPSGDFSHQNKKEKLCVPQVLSAYILLAKFLTFPQYVLLLLSITTTFANIDMSQ